MKSILYLSCHEVLEENEVRLFHELGYDIFSPGAYVCPENRGDGHLRPDITGLKYKQEFIDAYNKLAGSMPGKDIKDHLSKEFVDLFDIVIVMHIPHWISNNWEVMKHKRVIWRTIGQSTIHIEKMMQHYVSQGLEIVRYSPKEAAIPEYAGAHGLIRFYVDHNAFSNWNGNKERVITFAQDMQQRDQACNFTFFNQVTQPFNRALFGSKSENLEFGHGKVSFEQLKQEMRDNRVYFYTGTHPASYTLNFMEALTTGIPIVAIGKVYGNATYFPGMTDLYEIPDLITNGVNGFVSDDITQLRQYITTLLNDHDYAKSISIKGRELGLQHFNKDMIKNAWKYYLLQEK